MTIFRDNKKSLVFKKKILKNHRHFKYFCFIKNFDILKNSRSESLFILQLSLARSLLRNKNSLILLFYRWRVANVFIKFMCLAILISQTWIVQNFAFFLDFQIWKRSQNEGSVVVVHKLCSRWRVVLNHYKGRIMFLHYSTPRILQKGNEINWMHWLFIEELIDTKLLWRSCRWLVQLMWVSLKEENTIEYWQIVLTLL